jgi:hypothetical protein
MQDDENQALNEASRKLFVETYTLAGRICLKEATGL